MKITLEMWFLPSKSTDTPRAICVSVCEFFLHYRSPSSVSVFIIRFGLRFILCWSNFIFRFVFVLKIHSFCEMKLMEIDKKVEHFTWKKKTNVHNSKCYYFNGRRKKSPQKFVIFAMFFYRFKIQWTYFPTFLKAQVPFMGNHHFFNSFKVSYFKLTKTTKNETNISISFCVHFWDHFCWLLTHF